MHIFNHDYNYLPSTKICGAMITDLPFIDILISDSVSFPHPVCAGEVMQLCLLFG